MATWRFEIALLVLKNILLASPLTCEIFFNTQREISYLNMTLYYPLLPSPSTFPFHPFPSFLAPYPLLPTFSPPSGFLIYLSCPLYVHPLLYFLTLELLLSIFFPLFLLLVLFVLPLHTPCVLSSTFPAPITSTLSLLPSPFNFSFPSFSFFFFLPPYPLHYFLPPFPCSPLTSPFQFLSFFFFLLIPFFLPPYTPLVLFSTFPAPYTSTPPLITSPFNFSFPSFPLFFLPPCPHLPTSSPPPSYFLIYLSCPPILPPLLSLIVLSELFKCLTSVMILCNHAV